MLQVFIKILPACMTPDFDPSTLTEREREVLSLSQMLVLSAIRRLRTNRRVAGFLRREEKAIEMILIRIKKKGIKP